MLELRDVSYRAGKRLIIDRQSLAVPAGELLALVGPNGAGKSTLMGLLSGRFQPSGGTALLDQHPLRQWSSASLARRRAVMSQSTHMTFGFSAREVVALGRSAFDRSTFYREALHHDHIVEQALAAARVAHLADNPFPSLSGGEQQRVQFARALAQVWDAAPDPAWLLLDEPDAGLDIAHQVIILQTAKQFAQQGFGVAVVLHNLNLAAHYADRIALVHQGKIARQGPPSQVLETDYLSHIYGIRLQCVRGQQGETIIAPCKTA